MAESSASVPVRVALVQPVLPGYRVSVFRQLAEQEGIELTVFHGTNPDDSARGNTDLSNVDGFEHVALPTRTVNVFGLHFVWLSGLLGHARRDEFDVFVSTASPSILTTVVLALYLQWFGDANLVWWGKSLGQKSEPSTVGRVVRALGDYLRRPLYQMADACVCYSTAAAEYFQSYGVPESNTFVAYNSTDTSSMRRFEETYRDDPNALVDLHEAYDHEDRTMLFFVGTHTAEKHVDNLIDAQEHLLEEGQKSTLVIAGSGPLTDSLVSYADDVPHVHFTGRIPDEELARHFVLADVFAMPGHGGLAVQQAMTFGLPVVSTPLDGTEGDLIEEGENGYLVAEDDVDALMESLNRLLEMEPERRVELGKRSRAIVDERVNIDRMIGGFIDSIASVTGKSPTEKR